MPSEESTTHLGPSTPGTKYSLHLYTQHRQNVTKTDYPLCSSVVDDSIEIGKHFSGAHLYVIV